MTLKKEGFIVTKNLSVKTRYGTFNGFTDKNGVQTWLGIPYAQPPVGKLRWQAPQPLQPSDKTFDAKNFGAADSVSAARLIHFTTVQNLRRRTMLLLSR